MLPNGLLPPWARQCAFIAGGYAACPSLAEDIDVWVPLVDGPNCNEWDNVRAARQSLVDFLRASDTLRDHFTEQDGDNSPRAERPRDRLMVSTHENYVMPMPIYRVGTVFVPGAELPYHVIVVGANIDEVLSSFDISTHQVALTRMGVVKGEHWTPITEPPVVILKKYTTETRLQKIRARYGFDPVTGVRMCPLPAPLDGVYAPCTASETTQGNS